jgi:hypothetical protein
MMKSPIVRFRAHDSRVSAAIPSAASGLHTELRDTSAAHPHSARFESPGPPLNARESADLSHYLHVRDIAIWRAAAFPEPVGRRAGKNPGCHLLSHRPRHKVRKNQKHQNRYPAHPHTSFPGFLVDSSRRPPSILRHRSGDSICAPSEPPRLVSRPPPLDHTSDRPPSTTIVCPVTKSAVARYATAPAMSPPVPVRCNGTRPTYSSSGSSPGN